MKYASCVIWNNGTMEKESEDSHESNKLKCLYETGLHKIFDAREMEQEKTNHISSKNTVDFMTSIREIYSPQQLSMLSNTSYKLTRLMTPSTITSTKVSELISVMEVLRLHLPLLSTLMGIYVSFIPRLFQDH